jgi:phosphoserine phosphatase RsbU/P
MAGDPVLLARIRALEAENAALRDDVQSEGYKSVRLAVANAGAAELMAEQEESLERQKRLADSLADANARAGELMAGLEEALDRERALTSSLSEANARAAELMAELEEAHQLERVLREAERAKNAALVESQKALAEELSAAVQYVHSLLPPPLRGNAHVRTDWRFVPSLSLGGDAFGYHWVDPSRFAFYLLDVCGHGLSATLLATSVLGAVRDQRLGGADFAAPSSVLRALNKTFPMERHNQTYFTIWYGVFDRDAGTLEYASGGHPPALLLDEGRTHELETPNPMIGVADGVEFASGRHAIRGSESVFVFSDGAYEVTRTDGTMVGFEALRHTLPTMERASKTPIDDWLAYARRARGTDELEDDFSMLRVSFG